MEEERTAAAHLFDVSIATQTSSTSLIRKHFDLSTQVQKQEDQTSFGCNKTDSSSKTHS